MADQEEKRGLAEWLHLHKVATMVAGVGGAVISLILYLLSLPLLIAIFVGGISVGVFCVGLAAHVSLSNSRPMESLGLRLDTSLTASLATPVERNEAAQDAETQPEIELVGIERRDKKFQANSEPFTLILARYYFPNSASKPKLAVRGHVFFSRNNKPIKQVFNAAWNSSSRIHKQFKTGDAHDLIVGFVMQGGSKMVACEFGEPKLIHTPLSSSNFQIRIDLIGTGDDGRIARSTTRFVLTLSKGIRPKIENITHSAGQVYSQPSGVFQQS